MKPLSKLEIRQQADANGMSTIRVFLPVQSKERIAQEASLEGMSVSDYVLLKLGVLKHPSQKDKDKINTFGGLSKTPRCKRFVEGTHVRLKGGVHTTRNGATFRHHAKGGEVIYELRTSMESIFKPWSGEREYHSLFYSKFGKHLATYNSGHQIDVSIGFMEELISETAGNGKAISTTQVQDQDLGS